MIFERPPDSPVGSTTAMLGGWKGTLSSGGNGSTDGSLGDTGSGTGDTGTTNSGTGDTGSTGSTGTGDGGNTTSPGASEDVRLAGLNDTYWKQWCYEIIRERDPVTNQLTGLMACTFPAVNGTKLDWCREFRNNCGEPAARYFCVDVLGFSDISFFNRWFLDVPQTYLPATGETCRDKGSPWGWVGEQMGLQVGSSCALLLLASPRSSALGCASTSERCHNAHQPVLWANAVALPLHLPPALFQRWQQRLVRPHERRQMWAPMSVVKRVAAALWQLDRAMLDEWERLSGAGQQTQLAAEATPVLKRAVVYGVPAACIIVISIHLL